MNVATATASSYVPMCPVPTPAHATQALPLMMTEDHAKVPCMLNHDRSFWPPPLKLALFLEYKYLSQHRF